MAKNVDPNARPGSGFIKTDLFNENAFDKPAKPRRSPHRRTIHPHEIYLPTEIPNGIKKCCSACFTRICRKIAQMSSGTNSPAASAGGAQASSGAAVGAVKVEADEWNDEDIEVVKTELRNVGRNWTSIAAKLTSGKTPDQCKKFFYEYRKKFGLDKIVLEYKRVSTSAQNLKFVSSFLNGFLLCFRRTRLATSRPPCRRTRSPGRARRPARTSPASSRATGSPGAAPPTTGTPVSRKGGALKQMQFSY